MQQSRTERWISDVKIPTMLGLKEAADVTGLSYFHLRQLCLNNTIVYVRAGNKYLVNLDKLVEYLNGEQTESEVRNVE